VAITFDFGWIGEDDRQMLPLLHEGLLRRKGHVQMQSQLRLFEPQLRM
jgi:hypothetical protein